jgi:tetratricopeptide (TPR) repeat protein
MEIQTENGLKEALGYLENTNPEQAEKILEGLFEYDFECPELVFTADCCNFWIPYIKSLADMENPFERGESLLTEWKTFQSFVARKKHPYEPALYAVSRGIFSRALENYTQLFDERDPVQKAEIYRKAGLCFKKTGKFEDAQNCLSIANNTQPGLAAVLAELADCYALCGGDRNAKVLFREAFFIDPERIDISFLDSRLITCLIEKTAEKGYTGAVLQQWIPVYGVLWGIFNVKRELKPQEAGKLKQEIYALENEMKDPSSDAAVLTPRLINLYFWLIDHYAASNDTGRQINEVLLKIKILDSSIYEMYVK